MTKESSQDSSANTFLLDDEIRYAKHILSQLTNVFHDILSDRVFDVVCCSMPISLEEIADSMDAKEFQNVTPPSELVVIPAFQFLKS